MMKTKCLIFFNPDAISDNAPSGVDEVDAADRVNAGGDVGELLSGEQAGDVNSRAKTTVINNNKELILRLLTIKSSFIINYILSSNFQNLHAIAESRMYAECISKLYKNGYFRGP
jgi:hypothetical protein